MADRFRWGIVAPGNIANRMADALGAVEGAELYAVASRSEGRAAAFAEKHGFAHTFDSYEELAECAEVDIVYVASPHSFHRDNSALCLRAGKAVICEKPLTVNAAQAGELIAVAREHDSFLMEAMWTRFLPITEQIGEWLDTGAIGEARYLQAAFGFRCGWNPDSRLLDPALAGGGLLDVGVYPIAYAHWIFGGAPEQVLAAGAVGETGVDEQAAITLRWADGEIASLACAVRTATPHDAVICGTEGQIRIPAFWRATEATLHQGRDQTHCEKPFDRNGFEYEARHVQECLREGRTESPVMPLAESLAIQETLDACRRQVGVVYPFENGGAA